MRMRALATNLRVEIENENETRVFLESLDFEIEMRVSQKSGTTECDIWTEMKILIFTTL